MSGRRLLVALCFALLCSGILTWQISRHTAPRVPAVATRGVVVAAKDMSAGELLSPTALKVVRVPVWSSTITGLFSEPESLVGRVLLVKISSDELITAHELASTDVPAGLAATIPDGMRVVSVPVSSLSTGDARMITPGNRVDVLVSYHSDAAAAFVSSMLLQNVPVVGDSHKQVEGMDKPLSTEVVNLLVTPEQAARLTVACSLGKLTIALRNGIDKGLSQGLAQVALTALPSRQTASPSPISVKHAVVAAPRKSDFAVEMLSGGKTVIQTFPGSRP